MKCLGVPEISWREGVKELSMTKCLESTGRGGGGDVVGGWCMLVQVKESLGSNVCDKVECEQRDVM